MKKQWDDDYLRQAFQDEIELAGVHPQYCGRRFATPSTLSVLVDIFPMPSRHTHASQHSRTTLTWPLPHWRRTWNAAGTLSTELGLSIRHDLEEGTVSVGTGNRRRDVTESYAEHPDKDAATFAAIVRAAIRVCTEAREIY